MSCSRCKRSLPPGDATGLCKRCVRREAQPDTPAAPTTNPAAQEPAQPPTTAGASHVLSLRIKGSETGKKVTLPQTWAELKQLATAKVTGGLPVVAIYDADGDELDEIDVVWAMRPEVLYVSAAPASSPAVPRTAPTTVI